MSWSSCPFCTLQVLSTELERHANSHFEDEDLARDLQLAAHYHNLEDREEEDTASDFPQHISVDNLMQPASVSHDENADSSQTCGLMTLLKNCLECESGKSKTSGITILSGYVDHFQSVQFEDVGWGCGWRNIQMLTSHLLMQRREETKKVLFGGVGVVPDIPSLQRWLETAWSKGFDAAGSNDFNNKIYGKRSWIGTTECAALFRSFGIRARIVDFCIPTTDPRAVGPMDRYLKRPYTCDQGSSSNAKPLVNGRQLLVNWVWSYFSDNSSKLSRKSGCNQVVVTEKAPLYFQHDGHSRTIVGIQSKSLPDGTQQFNFLIFDPAHKTQALESCLRKKVGWERFIKRGVHTLKKTEYQLCYLDPGIATGVELENLKTLDSTRLEFEQLFENERGSLGGPTLNGEHQSGKPKPKPKLQSVTC